MYHNILRIMSSEFPEFKENDHEQGCAITFCEKMSCVRKPVLCPQIIPDYLGKKPGGKFGYINTTTLVGIGNCNNPFYMNERVENSRIVDCDALQHDTLPLSTGDGLWDRTFFILHWFVEVRGRVYDATAGPHLGNKYLVDYIAGSIDRTRRSVQEGAPPYPPFVPVEADRAGDKNDCVNQPALSVIE